MSKKKIVSVKVYLERRKTREYVGELYRDDNGYNFLYNDIYLYDKKSIPIGPDLPLDKQKHVSKKLFPSFEDRIPSKKNPAYEEYCRGAGISYKEKDLLVLVATIGQKGPSSFIFVPVYDDDDFGKEEMITFRSDLKLTIREFAEIFDFSPATIQRIEKGKSSGKDSLKRIELYYKFPEVALYEVRRSGFKVNDLVRERLENYFKKKIK